MAAGYFSLLRQNRAVRRLWYGQVTSELGDWLDSIALYTLILSLTGSSEKVAALLVAQFLPAAVVGLWAGAVVDRLPRKWVMIASDLGCAAVVPFFLLVRDADHIWLIYAVTIAKVSLTSFFEPARQALLTTVTAREDLVLANGISGATWSVMLAFGAALGGLVAGTLGIAAAFWLDSASFLLSAFCTWRVPAHETAWRQRERTGMVHEVRESFRFLWQHPDIALYASSKTLWSVGGGVLLLLTLFGERLFPIGHEGALSIGLLYAARGLGAGIGPLSAARWGGVSIRALRRGLGPGFLFMAVGYALFSQAPNIGLAALALVIAHIGGSIQWVFSTALLQMTVPERLQGRVFAIELTFLTLVLSLSNYLTGLANDAGVGPRTLALILSGVFVPSGVAMIVLLWRAPGEMAGKAHGAEGEEAREQATRIVGDRSVENMPAPE